MGNEPEARSGASGSPSARSGDLGEAGAEEVRRLRVDARQRHPVARWQAGPATVRCLLDRSLDSAGRDEPSQDYLAMAYSSHRLCFAVTDGVSSSFLGELAARTLAEGLTGWLCDHPPVRSEERFAADVQACLERLATESAESIARHPIPLSASGFVRELLEQRREYGSEAMVACGLIDFDGEAPAVALAWLGDVRLVVIGTDGTRHERSGRTADRWSTRLGPRGTVATWYSPLEGVARVVASSDGVVARDLEAVLVLGDARLDDMLAVSALRPEGDDMSFVDIEIAAGAMPPLSAVGPVPAPPEHTDDRPGQQEPGPQTAVAPESGGRQPGDPRSRPVDGPLRPPSEIPPPHVSWTSLTRGAYRLTWDRVPDADAYTVELSPTRSFEIPVAYQLHTTTFRPPPFDGPVWVRVRSHAAEGAGPWTPPIELSPTAAHRTAPEPGPYPSRPERAGPDLRVQQRGTHVQFLWQAPGPCTLRLVSRNLRRDVRVDGGRFETVLPHGQFFARIGFRTADGAVRWGGVIDFVVPA
ncbi:protein phosphatase 2C domain-containing protein [Dactylosporangium sp. NPDC049140]|jgi:hypothetical protein|uniref:protein phosphatase 2C domain-containing protein n=1 Tax=Dactylosporangium sp. NPDC049140 TaxID=3155647 RepID=UPI0033FD2C7A